MARLKFVTLFSFTLSLALALFGPDRTLDGEILPADWLKNTGTIYTPKEHIRPGDQTFLTYPEWYLVHSPREQAEYLTHFTSTSFPYWTHILQLWKSYRIVNRQISGRFAFNGGYHLMIGVIATSTTVEYAIKAFYEKLVGRITDTRRTTTAEDQFNARYWADYTKFIMQTPWYEYDYFSELKKLWLENPVSGGHMLRKWERRFYLTTEFLIKGAYGWAIKKATKSIYEEPILGTAVVLQSSVPISDARVKILKKNEDGSLTYLLPRYADFAVVVHSLARQGVTFREVAGNQSAILLTLHADKVAEFEKEKVRILFTQPIVTKPGVNRVAVAVRVADLSYLLLSADAQKLRVEHIYDF